MSDAKHVPGPWGYDMNHTIATFDDEDWGKSIAQLPVGSHGRPPTVEEQANARLIAAAPDLLAACKAFEEYYAHGDLNQFAELQKTVRDAIAKATSQP